MPYATLEEKTEYNRKYYKENKEKLKEHQRKYRSKNRERVLAANKEYYLKNKEFIRNSSKRYRESNKEILLPRAILNGIRRRAKERGIPFDLEISDITPPECCPVFGIMLSRGIGAPSPNSPSVDRILPEVGYVKGNIQIISNRANLMKSDATPEELVLFAKWVQRTYPEMF